MTNHKPCKRDHIRVSHYYAAQWLSYTVGDSNRHPLSATQNSFYFSNLSCTRIAHRFSGTARCWTWRGWSAPSPRKKCSVFGGLYSESQSRIRGRRPTPRRMPLRSQSDHTPLSWSGGCVRLTWLVRGRRLPCDKKKKKISEDRFKNRKKCNHRIESNMLVIHDC